jgi:hypothetical protein
MVGVIRCAGVDVKFTNRIVRRYLVDKVRFDDIARETRICADLLGLLFRLAVGCHMGRGRGLSGTHGLLLVPDLRIKCRVRNEHGMCSVLRQGSRSPVLTVGTYDECVLWVRKTYGSNAYMTQWQVRRDLMDQWHARQRMVERLLLPKNRDLRVEELRKCNRPLIELLREKYGIGPAFEAEALTA